MEEAEVMTDVMTNENTQNFVLRAFNEGGTAMYVIAMVGLD